MLKESCFKKNCQIELVQLNNINITIQKKQMSFSKDTKAAISFQSVCWDEMILVLTRVNNLVVTNYVS